MPSVPGSPPVVQNSGLVRARLILPIVQPPIENGAIAIVDGRIVEVGRWGALKNTDLRPVRDLGEVVLLPGLINAHCHLDYTGMAGLISPPKLFSDWIKALLALKAHWTYSDYAASWLLGAKMLLNHGVTTVADIEAVPELLPEVRSATPLRVCSLFEMTGVKSRRPAAEILEETVQHALRLPPGADWAGLSPHALYSTSPELLRISAEAARQRGWLMAIHVSESAEESEMFLHGNGPLYDWLKPQRNMSDCGHGSPVALLAQSGALGKNLLAIHVNYLSAGDASLLARSGTSVVHCPRSHAYFRHARFDLAQLEREGVNVCVGTDSLASVAGSTTEKLELSLLSELRSMGRSIPGLGPEKLLGFVTVQAAQALGRKGALGQLTPGALADLFVIPGRVSVASAYEAVLNHTQPAAGVMINGVWILGR